MTSPYQDVAQVRPSNSEDHSQKLVEFVWTKIMERHRTAA